MTNAADRRAVTRTGLKASNSIAVTTNGARGPSIDGMTLAVCILWAPLRTARRNAERPLIAVPHAKPSRAKEARWEMDQAKLLGREEKMPRTKLRVHRKATLRPRGSGEQNPVHTEFDARDRSCMLSTPI